MLRAVGRLLDLSEDEFRRAWPLFAYLFLTMSGTVASKATRDALFLDRYRAIDLPYVDIAIAGLVGVSVSLYIRASRWLPLRTLQLASLLFFAANCLGLLVAEPRTVSAAAGCSSPSTCGSACSACWRRPRSGRWPTSS